MLATATLLKRFNLKSQFEELYRRPKRKDIATVHLPWPFTPTRSSRIHIVMISSSKSWPQVCNHSRTQVNVEQLNIFEDGAVTLARLKEKKLVPATARFLKILGDGPLRPRLVVEANYFTNSAKFKIEQAGGAISVLLHAWISQFKRENDRSCKRLSHSWMHFKSIIHTHSHSLENHTVANRPTHTRYHRWCRLALHAAPGRFTHRSRPS